MRPPPPITDAGASDDGRVPLRTQLAVYGVGTFSTTMHFMAITIVPLWVVGLELSPFVLGIVLGCRPFLSLFLSIHIGALMDRMGGRRVMLFFAILGTLAPLLYPLAPHAVAIILLQMIWGLADSMGWLGAQTLIGQLMQGRTLYASRLSVISRAGNVIGPPVVGAVWDLAGPWGAFGLAGLWGVGAIISAWMLPRTAGMPPTGEPATEAGAGLRALMPNMSDYVSTFRLLAVPTIAITAAIGMMTHLGNNIQSSFYVVWLNDIGIPGTLIGILLSLASVAAGVGPLLAAPLSRWISPYWLLWIVVLGAILLIVITPMLGTFLVISIVLCIRSLFNGVHQPLVITLMLCTAGPGDQGKVIGLRATANRVTSIAAPVLMGAIAEVVGIENSFYILGVIATVTMLGILLWMTRHPEIHENAREG